MTIIRDKWADLLKVKGEHRYPVNSNSRSLSYRYRISHSLAYPRQNRGHLFSRTIGQRHLATTHRYTQIGRGMFHNSLTPKKVLFFLNYPIFDTLFKFSFFPWHVYNNFTGSSCISHQLKIEFLVFQHLSNQCILVQLDSNSNSKLSKSVNCYLKKHSLKICVLNFNINVLNAFSTRKNLFIKNDSNKSCSLYSWSTFNFLGNKNGSSRNILMETYKIWLTFKETLWKATSLD